MIAQENTLWLYDYGIEDIPVADAIFADHNPEIPQVFYALPNAAYFVYFNVETDGSFGEPNMPKETSSKKRARSDTCAPSNSKACREKLRRDRLNDKFMELAALLDPGKPPKADKDAILVDAVRMITQKKSEAQKLKDSNLNFQEKIKELKAEKNELREEKQKLKAEKEKLEKQLKTMSKASFPASSIPAAFAAQSQAANKFVPVLSYPSVAMWQFLPPGVVDTSHDHSLRPPVA